MLGYRYKRISAYILDMLLVMFLTVMFTSVDFINPRVYDYNEAFSEYNEVYSDAVSNLMEEESAEEFRDKLAPSLFALEKTNLYQLIWFLVFYLLYFVVFAYFTGGQTLGKKLFKLKVVKYDGTPASPLALFIRSILSGSSVYFGVGLLVLVKILAILIITSATLFFNVYMFISSIGLVFEGVLIWTFIFNKEHLAIHDKIARTKVIDLKNSV